MEAQRRYQRDFETIDDLDDFVLFQQQENGLTFHWDRVRKTAWIITDEETEASLYEEEIHQDDA
jgi:hypothetical protein